MLSSCTPIVSSVSAISGFIPQITVCAPMRAAASEICDSTEHRWLSMIQSPVMSITRPDEPSR